MENYVNIYKKVCVMAKAICSGKLIAINTHMKTKKYFKKLTMKEDGKRQQRKPNDTKEKEGNN